MISLICSAIVAVSSSLVIVWYNVYNELIRTQSFISYSVRVGSEKFLANSCNK